MSFLSSVSKPIWFPLTIKEVQTENKDFHVNCKWKKAIILTCVYIIISFWHFLRERICAGVAVISTLCMCVRIDLLNAQWIRVSWEISSKLDFKRTWGCLMRCWSGVRLWRPKKWGEWNSFPAWTIFTHRIILLWSWFAMAIKRSGPLWGEKWDFAMWRIVGNYILRDLIRDQHVTLIVNCVSKHLLFLLYSVSIHD